LTEAGSRAKSASEAIDLNIDLPGPDFVQKGSGVPRRLRLLAPGEGRGGVEGARNTLVMS